MRMRTFSEGPLLFAYSCDDEARYQKGFSSTGGSGAVSFDAKQMLDVRDALLTPLGVTTVDASVHDEDEDAAEEDADADGILIGAEVSASVSCNFSNSMENEDR